MARPTFALKAPRYRGRTSTEINEMFQSIETDLHSAYLDTTTLRQKLRELQTALAHEQIALSSRVQTLADRVTELLTEADKQLIVRDFSSLANIVYFPTGLVPSYNQATVDTMFNTCYLPISSDVSQIRYSDLVTEETIINANTTVTVNPLADGAFGESDGVVEETDPLNMLDGSAATFYQRRVKFPIYASQPAVECEIIVTLPQNFDTYTNTIDIQPYPEGGVTILAIDFAPVSNPTAYESISPTTFANGPLLSSGRLTFRLNKIEAGALRIKLRQDRWTIENNQRVFTYGIRDLDLRRTIYNNTGELGISFSLPSNVAGFFNLVKFTMNPVDIQGTRTATLYPTYSDFITKSNGTRIQSDNIDIRSFTTRDLYVGIALTHTIIDAGTPSLSNIIMEYTTFGS